MSSTQLFTALDCEVGVGEPLSLSSLRRAPQSPCNPPTCGCLSSPNLLEVFARVLTHLLGLPQSLSQSRSAVSDSLRPHGLYSPWDSPGQNTGVGSLSLLQGNFRIQGSNQDPCRRSLYQLSYQRSPQSWRTKLFPLPRKV